MVIMRLVVFTLLSVVFFAGCTASQTSQTAETGADVTGEKHMIDITPDGFSPRTLSIKVSDTIVFVNKDADPHWPASDIHPTHGVYPDKDGCIGSKFDACRGLNTGEAYEFTFLHEGSWCFHDHLMPGLTGCVDVQ